MQTKRSGERKPVWATTQVWDLETAGQPPKTPTLDLWGKEKSTFNLLHAISDPDRQKEISQARRPESLPFIDLTGWTLPLSSHPHHRYEQASTACLTLARFNSRQP